MKELSIIIVTYKEELDLLKACFDSVYASADVDFECIVVDNGNNPATAGLLSSYPGAVYVPNKKNEGFAAAVNVGMRRSTGKYVLLLNPDTEYASDVLAKMVAHLDEDESVGVASSVIRYPDGSLQESIRRFPRLLDQTLIMLKFPHVFKQMASIDKYMMRDVSAFETQDVDSIMGAFMFIRREVLDQIGLFDERYFIWFEEVDYCKMAHDAGWNIRHYADVEIMHHKGHTFNKIATIRKQKWMRTSLRKYMKKHHGFAAWAFLWMMSPLFIVLAYVSATIKKA